MNSHFKNCNISDKVNRCHFKLVKVKHEICISRDTSYKQYLGLSAFYNTDNKISFMLHIL